MARKKKTKLQLAELTIQRAKTRKASELKRARSLVASQRKPRKRKAGKKRKSGQSDLKVGFNRLRARFQSRGNDGAKASTPKRRQSLARAIKRRANKIPLSIKGRRALNARLEQETPQVAAFVRRAMSLGTPPAKAIKQGRILDNAGKLSIDGLAKR